MMPRMLALAVMAWLNLSAHAHACRGGIFNGEYDSFSTVFIAKIDKADVQKIDRDTDRERIKGAASFGLIEVLKGTPPPDRIVRFEVHASRFCHLSGGVFADRYYVFVMSNADVLMHFWDGGWYGPFVNEGDARNWTKAMTRPPSAPNSSLGIDRK